MVVIEVKEFSLRYYWAPVVYFCSDMKADNLGL
jgi:hypothetical protein